MFLGFIFFIICLFIFAIGINCFWGILKVWISTISIREYVQYTPATIEFSNNLYRVTPKAKLSPNSLRGFYYVWTSRRRGLNILPTPHSFAFCRFAWEDIRKHAVDFISYFVPTWLPWSGETRFLAVQDSVLYAIHAVCSFHPASYRRGTRDSFLWCKTTEAWSWPLTST